MDPIIIQGNSIVPFLSTLVQRGVLLAIGYFGLTGQVSNDETSKIAAGIVAVLLVGWGAVKSYVNNEKAKQMEKFVPNSVATRK